MKKVLVADDSATSRELIRIILERSGHAVFEARDGSEAVRKAHDLLPDLIVLDLRMPLLDGFGVLMELRGDYRLATTQVVVLTASAMQGDRERALSAGFTHYLVKPMSVPALRNAMDRLLK
jgi:two-component system, cell cycle response regulator DivK